MTKAKTIEDKCMNWFIARMQRREERERGVGDKGTEGFERAGCFKGDGHDKTCPSYCPAREYVEELYLKYNKDLE